MNTKAEATIEDLYAVPENAKAELVNGRLVHVSPTGFLPSRASMNIVISLRSYERQTSAGYAIPDNAGFVVNLPNRESFSPDASFYTGQPTGMRFLQGAPIFAAEVRSEGDYGTVAEREMAAKRSDYFAAGTQVVWDVDLRDPDTIRSYRSDAPDQPIIFRRGEIADAEPALPGWSMAVDDLFA